MARPRDVVTLDDPDVIEVIGGEGFDPKRDPIAPIVDEIETHN